MLTVNMFQNFQDWKYGLPIIAPNMEIRVIDTFNGLYFIKSVEEIFTQYAQYINPHNGIEFSRDNKLDVQISENEGWTRLKNITKVKIDKPHWYEVKSENGQSLIIDDNGFLAIFKKYDVEQIGFHGSRSKSWYIGNPSKLSPDLQLRVRDSDDRFIYTGATATPVECEFDYGYQIITEHGLVDVNNILIFADTEVEFTHLMS